MEDRITRARERAQGAAARIAQIDVAHASAVDLRMLRRDAYVLLVNAVRLETIKEEEGR